MKKATFMVSFVVVLLFWHGACLFANPVIRGNIPFDFTVGDKLHPAGNYSGNAGK